MSYLWAILIVGFLILVHEVGHYLAAKLWKMRVLRFSIGFGPALVKWQPKRSETTFQLSAIPLGGFVQIAGMDLSERTDPPDPARYDSKPLRARLAVVAAGPVTNWLLAAIAFSILFGIGFPQASDEPVLGEVPRGRPAHAAGLREGDRVLAVDGREVDGWTALARATGESEGRPIVVRVSRRGEAREFVVKALQDRRSERWLIGIAPRTEYVKKPIVTAVGWGFAHAALSTVALFYQIGSALFGSGSADFMGPVGIVEMVSERVERGIRDVLLMAAGLSIALFGLNFLPLPALDGGRLVFLGYEAVTRRRVPRRFETAVHAVGLVFLLGILVLVTFRDILLAGS